MVKKYQTETQEKYLNDMIIVLSNQINFISKEYEKDCFDNNENLRTTNRFTGIDSNEAVQKVFDLLNFVIFILGNVCQSIKYKKITEFRHLVTKKEFLARDDLKLKKSYRELSFYIILPGYSALREKILLEIKAD